MISYLKTTLFPVLAVCWTVVRASSAQPAFSIDSIFCDGMVVQQGKPITLRGNALTNGATITVGLDDRSWETTADGGRWEITVDNLELDGTGNIVVSSSGESLTISNVVAGEVWIISGGSGVAGLLGDTNVVDDPEYYVEYSENEAVRIWQPGSGKWKSIRTDNSASLSALAVLTGMRLHTFLHRPIGLIVHPDVVDGLDIQGKYRFPSQFAVKGLFMRMDGDASRFQSLIREYRQAQGEDVPVLLMTVPDGGTYTQYSDAGAFPPTKTYEDGVLASAEEYWRVRRDVPSARILNTSDISVKSPLWVSEKHGERMAQGAMDMVYDLSIVCTGPIYRGYCVEGDSIRVFFEFTNGGLSAMNDSEIQGVRIGGDGDSLRWANVRIDGEELIVYHSTVEKPTRVQYAPCAVDDNYANLGNIHGYGAMSFDTDWGSLDECGSLPIYPSDGIFRPGVADRRPALSFIDRMRGYGLQGPDGTIMDLRGRLVTVPDSPKKRESKGFHQPTK